MTHYNIIISEGALAEECIEVAASTGGEVWFTNELAQLLKDDTKVFSDNDTRFQTIGDLKMAINPAYKKTDTGVKPYWYAGALVHGKPYIATAEEYDMLGEELSSRYQALYTEDQVEAMLKKRLDAKYVFVIGSMQHGTNFMGKSQEVIGHHERMIYWLKERQKALK